MGVTGHRWRSEPAGLRGRVTGVMEEAAGRRQVHLASALAEGADRLVAEVALGMGARLVAVLPLPPDEYEADFEGEESRAAFRALLGQAAEVIEVGPVASDRSELYAAAGSAILDRSEVLVAIWDGRPGRGPGGTAAVITEAGERRIPVLWVAADPPFDLTVLEGGTATSGAGVPPASGRT